MPGRLGETWVNGSGAATLYGDGIADLPDPGCKGSIARWEAGKGLVAANVQDNLDPGGPEQVAGAPRRGGASPLTIASLAHQL